MAKNCLNKLSGNILQDCTVAPVGIKAIYLMHTEDVQTIALNTLRTSVNSISFTSTGRSYKVEGYKQNIQFTTSLKTTDASAKLNTTISFKMPLSGDAMPSIAMGRFYALVEFNSASYSFVGAMSPLECSGLDFDSNANAGLVTVTLSDPEGSAGNHYLTCSSGAKDSIISKSV